MKEGIFGSVKCETKPHSFVEAIFPISENCYWSKQLIELKSHKRFCIIFANNRYFFSLRIKRCLLTQTPLVVLKSVLISKRNQGTWWCQHETKESQNGKSGNTEVLYARYDTAWSPLAKSLPRRCLWTLILVGSFAFCQYHTYESWMQFLQRPFSVGITLKSTKESTLTFPAVTLCNVNPQNVQRALHLLDARNKEDAKQIIDDVTKLMHFSKEFVNEDILERYPELFDRDKIVARWTFNSHQIGEMLLPNIPPTYTSCSFDGVLCGTENFSSFASSSFG